MTDIDPKPPRHQNYVLKEVRDFRTQKLQIVEALTWDENVNQKNREAAQARRGEGQATPPHLRACNWLTEHQDQYR